MSDTLSRAQVLNLAAQIVSAHLAHNAVPLDNLSALIRSVVDNLATAGTQPEKPKPAVPINKSVFPDHLVCLEDGTKLTMLKRHLRTAFNMTPQQYRERWGLPANYPMVAPDYAKQRSSLAKKIPLGRKRLEPKEPPLSNPVRRGQTPGMRARTKHTTARSGRARS